MELINQFGLNPVLLAAQIVNFLIVFFVLKKFLYKPILETLKKREKTIQDGIKNAQTAETMLENATNKEKAILKNAQVEAKKLLEETKKQTALLMQNAETTARKRTEKMLKEAEAQIQEDAKKTEQRLITNVSAVAIQLLQESLGDLFSEKHQEELISKAVKKLKNKPN